MNLVMRLVLFGTEFDTKTLYRFSLDKANTEVANGTADNFRQILDLLEEAMLSNFPENFRGKPSSLTDLAFSSGLIHERERLIKLLDLEASLDKKLNPKDLLEQIRLGSHLENSTYVLLAEQIRLQEQDRIIGILRAQNKVAPIGWDRLEWLVSLIETKEDN